VSIAACLVLYSLVVLVIGPLLLRRLTQNECNPRLGAAAWMTAIASVLVSWIAAATLTLVDVARHWGHPGTAIADCLAIMRGIAAGNAGAATQIALPIATGLGAVAVAISVGRFVRIIACMRRRTHGHARAVRLVGRRVDGLDAVVIDAAEPAAYCVPGRPNAVVVTSAALNTLTWPQLAAILSHEHAHLNGHHPQIVAIMRGLAATFPGLRLMTEGAHQVSRLLEMCADDRAASSHGTQPVLGGILALTGAAPASAGALGATGVAVLDRAERLTSTRRAGLARNTVTAAVIAVAAGSPLATAGLAAFGALMCQFW
jgi:beta-lactamase regulating signal transducer with metallopeptidase domain